MQNKIYMETGRAPAETKHRCVFPLLAILMKNRRNKNRVYLVAHPARR